MDRRISILALCLLCGNLLAQNPISPMGVYIADPTARVGQDGRMYIYGSLDESTDYYCSNDYHVLSSADLRTWMLHPYAFRNDGILYAPDMMFRNGVYYLYYDCPDGGEYVAVGDSPAGPFRDGVPIEGAGQIDPNIFVDDDGQAYYFWGQFSSKGAKMNPDMKTLDLSTVVDGILTEKDHHFHEASYVIKREGWYYYLFADISRNGRPTSLGYAMARSPLGPYTYKGVIIDNAGCDPETWNNHGSLVRFGDDWYVLYHRSTHASNTMRKACIEPIRFNADGTIDEVEMTSQGAGGPLDAFDCVDAARACRMQGHVRIQGMEGRPAREILAQARPGDAAVWKYLDFGKGAVSVSVRARSAAGGRLVLHADSADGRVLSRVDIPAGNGWRTVPAPVKSVQGVHALWMTFEGEMDVDWFHFGNAPDKKRY